MFFVFVSFLYNKKNIIFLLYKNNIVQKFSYENFATIKSIITVYINY